MNRILEIKQYMDEKAARYETPAFLPNDPISIPHRFQRKQDIEIAGFFAAILAWGQRTSIIRSCERLLGYMDDSPYDFIRYHKPSDVKPMLGFVHRTFNATDLLWMLRFLQEHYAGSPTLETAFSRSLSADGGDIETALTGFHDYVFRDPMAPERTRKHIADPQKKSACKRLNMYLRWMVRNNERGVDFGIWDTIRPYQLACPLDVHVGNVARRLGLLERRPNDWKAVLELTARLRELDPEDPVKYDFALFGLGIEERFR